MGTIRQGANGGFSGKTGSIIGSSWKGIDYIKGLSRKRTKAASEEQLIVQARFYAMTKFLMPIAPILRLGFGLVNSDRMTPTNVALKQNIDQAVIGTYPNFELDYSKIKISAGSFIGGGTTGASASLGLLSVTWDATLSTLYQSKADDQVIILMYQPTANEFMTAPTPPLRADSAIDISIPDHLLGAKGHVWIFFADRKGTKVSGSTYLGEIDLL
ncbi:DUF6266 family protein [Sphingobacterium sp. JUb56]|uniref:DUF6266 family protein n=1 Tax=Sphingobacterium sp. JUb56 TaxID=2587145 RepID=UPI00160EB8D6|nr:DUF6266 family protein [Sphingobacterium sp. JUb56]MBB2953351.1 hypothetical protein [Sphingobacterium sp. JUb56]